MSASSDLVQYQLDAYNMQDVEALVACYAPDAVLAGLNGSVTQSGRDAIRARHKELFTQYPENRAKLLSRIDLGSTVIDHEEVSRAPDGERFEVAAIYTLQGGKISRVDFARSGEMHQPQDGRVLAGGIE